MFIDSNLKVIHPSSWVHEGVQYPARVFREWSDEQLSGIGVYRVVLPDVETPEGKEVVGWEYEITNHVALASPVFGDVVEEVPESVSRAQGKAAMLSAGMLEACQGYIETLEGTERVIAELAFNDTNEWRRDSPFLNEVARELGVTEEQKDNLFISASKIIL